MNFVGFSSKTREFSFKFWVWPALWKSSKFEALDYISQKGKKKYCSNIVKYCMQFWVIQFRLCWSDAHFVVAVIIQAERNFWYCLQFSKSSRLLSISILYFSGCLCCFDFFTYIPWIFEFKHLIVNISIYCTLTMNLWISHFSPWARSQIFHCGGHSRWKIFLIFFWKIHVFSFNFWYDSFSKNSAFRFYGPFYMG